jgi:DNA-binding transcriptional LysR family regulator
MELSQLRAFISVLDSGSMLHASKALKISRTTVHTRLAGLEESLGVELLVRTHRGVHPTEFGRDFASRARSLLEEADALSRAAARQREEVLGQLYLRVCVGLPPQFSMTLMREIARRHPEVALRFEVTKDPTDEIPPEVDIVLHFAPAVPAGPFRTFALSRFPEHLLASSRYLDAHGRPESLDDLAEHRLMSWSPPGERGSHLPLRDGGMLPWQPDVISEEVHVLHCLAAAGQGIALVPDNPRLRAIVPGDPREVVLPELVGRESSLWVLLPEAQADTPRSRAAVRLLRDISRGVFCLSEIEQMPRRGDDEAASEAGNELAAEP